MYNDIVYLTKKQIITVTLIVSLEIIAIIAIAVNLYNRS